MARRLQAEEEVAFDLVVATIPELAPGQVATLAVQANVLPGTPPGMQIPHSAIVEYHSASLSSGAAIGRRATAAAAVTGLEVVCDAVFSCSGNGACLPPGLTGGVAQCVCAAGWTGPNCCYCDSSAAPADQCYGAGVCAPDGGGQCDCSVDPASGNATDPFCRGILCSDAPELCDRANLTEPFTDFPPALLGTCAGACEVSSWGNWSECTRSCGNGTQTRLRNITVPATYGGVSCPALEETRFCNEQACSGSAAIALCEVSRTEFAVSVSLPLDTSPEQWIATAVLTIWLILILAVLGWFMWSRRYHESWRPTEWLAGTPQLWHNWRNHLFLFALNAECVMLAGPLFITAVPWHPYFPLKAIVRMAVLTVVRNVGVFWTFFGIFGVFIVFFLIVRLWYASARSDRVSRLKGRRTKRNALARAPSSDDSDSSSHERRHSHTKESEVIDARAVETDEPKHGPLSRSAKGGLAHKGHERPTPNDGLEPEDDEAVRASMGGYEWIVFAFYIFCGLLLVPVLDILLMVWQCGFPWGGYRFGEAALDCFPVQCWHWRHIVTMIISAILLGIVLPLAAASMTIQFRWDEVNLDIAPLAIIDVDGRQLSKTPRRAWLKASADLWMHKLEVQMQPAFAYVLAAAKITVAYCGIILARSVPIAAFVVAGLTLSGVLVWVVYNPPLTLHRLRRLPQFMFFIAAVTVWMLLIVYLIDGNDHGNSEDIVVDNFDQLAADKPTTITSLVLVLALVAGCTALWLYEEARDHPGLDLFRSFEDFEAEKKTAKVAPAPSVEDSDEEGELSRVVPLQGDALSVAPRGFDTESDEELEAKPIGAWGIRERGQTARVREEIVEQQPQIGYRVLRSEAGDELARLPVEAQDPHAHAVSGAWRTVWLVTVMDSNGVAHTLPSDVPITSTAGQWRLVGDTVVVEDAGVDGSDVVLPWSSERGALPARGSWKLTTEYVVSSDGGEELDRVATDEPVVDSHHYRGQWRFASLQTYQEAPTVSGGWAMQQPTQRLVALGKPPVPAQTVSGTPKRTLSKALGPQTGWRLLEGDGGAEVSRIAVHSGQPGDDVKSGAWRTVWLVTVMDSNGVAHTLPSDVPITSTAGQWRLVGDTVVVEDAGVDGSDVVLPWSSERGALPARGSWKLTTEYVVSSDGGEELDRVATDEPVVDPSAGFTGRWILRSETAAVAAAGAASGHLAQTRGWQAIGQGKVSVVAAFGFHVDTDDSDIDSLDSYLAPIKTGDLDMVGELVEDAHKTVHKEHEDDEFEGSE